MKNMFKITLALILVMSVIAFMFACGKDDAAETTGATNAPTESSDSGSDSGSDSDTLPGDDGSSSVEDDDSSSSSEEITISQNDKIPGVGDEDAAYGEGWSDPA